jgi:hypothetical protein
VRFMRRVECDRKSDIPVARFAGWLAFLNQTGACAPRLYWARNLRSRWQNKAWAASPRIEIRNGSRAREAGGSAVAHFAGSMPCLLRDPGACAPGFILPPASQVPGKTAGQPRSRSTLEWQKLDENEF